MKRLLAPLSTLAIFALLLPTPSVQAQSSGDTPDRAGLPQYGPIFPGMNGSNNPMIDGRSHMVESNLRSNHGYRVALRSQIHSMYDNGIAILQHNNLLLRFTDSTKFVASRKAAKRSFAGRRDLTAQDLEQGLPIQIAFAYDPVRKIHLVKKIKVLAK